MRKEDLAKEIKVELPYISLQENEIQEVLTNNHLVFIPSPYRDDGRVFFTKEQDQLLNFAYSHNIDGISILGKEEDYEVLALKDDVIDLGIIILTSPEAQQILFGVLGNVFYDILKSSIKYVFRFRINTSLNKVGELKYQNENEKFELKKVELSNEVMLKIINKLTNESHKNKIDKRSKRLAKGSKRI